jgi:hypothetical protein
MSDQALATLDKPAPPRAVTGKVRKAIDAMVWLGLSRDEAAAHAGLAVHSLYQAFRKPSVKSHYLRELDVLRTSERARNVHALIEVRSQPDNQMARVQAVKALEQLSDTDQGRGGAAPAQPGIVIQIVTNSPTLPTLNANGDLIDE